MATVFPLVANAKRPPYRVRWSYQTDITEAWDGSEQRRCLRSIPIRRESFTATTLFARPTQWADALLYGGQTTQWLLPYWPHGAYLTTAISDSATSLVCETADREFVAGDHALLWRDELTYEVVTIGSVSGTGLAALTRGQESTAAQSWAAGTIVLPLRTARWAGEIGVGRHAATGQDVEVAFELDAVPDPAVSTPSIPEVFAVVPLERERDNTETLERLAVRIGPATGTFAEVARRTTPRGHRSHPLWLASKARIADVVEWFHGVRGAWRAFWLPTYRADLTLAEDLAADATEMVVVAAGYTAHQFPYEARQHLGFIQPDGTITHRHVTASVDNGDGTETLTLSGLVGTAFPVGYGLVSFLWYVRNNSDDLEIAWLNANVAEATLAVVETSGVTDCIQLAADDFESYIVTADLLAVWTETDPNNIAGFTLIDNVVWADQGTKSLQGEFFDGDDGLDHYVSRTFTGLTPGGTYRVTVRCRFSEPFSDTGALVGIEVEGVRDVIPEAGPFSTYLTLSVDAVADVNGHLQVRLGSFEHDQAIIGGTRHAFFDRLSLTQGCAE